MTLKQGQEINNKFSFLSDSIKNLNEKYSFSKSELGKLSIEKQKVDSNLLISNKNLLMYQSNWYTSEKEIKKLSQYIIDQDKSFWRERREWGVWMVLSMVVTVLVASGR
jgi:hypothetical protein